METEKSRVKLEDSVIVFPAFILFNFILSQEKIVGFNRFIADMILILSLLITSLALSNWNIKSLGIEDKPARSIFLFIYGLLMGLFLKMVLIVYSIDTSLNMSTFPINILDPAWRILYTLSACMLFQGIFFKYTIKPTLKTIVSSLSLSTFLIPLLYPLSIESVIVILITVFLSSIVSYKVNSLIPSTFMIYMVSLKGIVL